LQGSVRPFTAFCYRLQQARTHLGTRLIVRTPETAQPSRRLLTYSCLDLKSLG
jgi:hypothetical protein